MCPINIVAPGKRVEVLKLLGGCSFSKRLQEMGIVPGSVLDVVRNDGGPLMIGVGNARFALGRGIGDRVYVREL